MTLKGKQLVLVPHTCCPSQGFPWWRCELGCSGPSQRTPHRTSLFPKSLCRHSHWSHRCTAERNEGSINQNAVTESRRIREIVRNFTQRNMNFEGTSDMKTESTKSRILRINIKMEYECIYFFTQTDTNTYNAKLQGNMTLCYENVSVVENEIYSSCFLLVEARET